MNAADIALIRPLWMPKSFVAVEDCRFTVKQWLIDGNYYVNDPEEGFSLYCHGGEEIRKSLSLDAFRFATHSAQTIFELEKSSAYTRLTSWRVIQVYYAAHATLRFLGKSFSHLEPGHTTPLVKRCLIDTGKTSNLPYGFYLLAYESIDSNLRFEKYSDSHKDLWSAYLQVLQDLSSGVLRARATDERKQKISNHFSDIATSICNRGKNPSGNWLSSLRNEVNYKSMHGVWYPFSKQTSAFSRLMAKISKWRSCQSDLEQPNLLNNELERFFVTCLAIVDLALTMSFDYKDLAKETGRRSSDFSRMIQESAAA